MEKTVVSHHLRALSWVLFLGLIVVTCPAAHGDKPDKSPFMGDYSGQYTFKSSGAPFATQEGKVTLAIDAEGKITGEAKNKTVDKAADVTGSVNEDGELKITIEFPNQTSTAKGTVTKTKKG